MSELSQKKPSTSPSRSRCQRRVTMILSDHHRWNFRVVGLIDSCVSQQAADAGKPASPHHSLLVAANQAAVINAAKSASASPGGALSKTAVTTLVKGTVGPAAKATAGPAAAVGAAAKGVNNVPLVSMSKGAGAGALVGAPKGTSTSLVPTASLVGAVPAGGGKTGATLSGERRHSRVPHTCPGADGSHAARPVFWSAGMLKIHSGGPSSQQTVLTIPANQLKQLGVGAGAGGLQTILMPVGKGKVETVTGLWLWCVPSLRD